MRVISFKLTDRDESRIKEMSLPGVIAHKISGGEYTERRAAEGHRPREISWCIVFRQGNDMPWRAFDERHSHHGASDSMAEGKLKHPAWEFRLAKQTTEWEWDD